MRKFLHVILLTLFIITSIQSSYAANKRNDTTTYYGAKKGGFSLSVGILPAVNFVGNMFNGTSKQSFSGFNNASYADFNGSILTASYFLLDKMSLTAGVGINCNKNKAFTYGENDNKENIKVTGSNEIAFTLGANYLLRQGARIQPILGGSLMYGFVNQNFEREDDKTSINADFNHKSPSSTFGVICNVGIECFLSKAISISAVADLALTMTKNKYKVDDWDEQKTTLNSTQTNFTTGQLGGNLALNFYF